MIFRLNGCSISLRADTKFDISKVLLKPQGCLPWKTSCLIFLHLFSYSLSHCVASDHSVAWTICRAARAMELVSCGEHSWGVSSPAENLSFISGCFYPGALSKGQEVERSCTIGNVFNINKDWCLISMPKTRAICRCRRGWGIFEMWADLAKSTEMIFSAWEYHTPYFGDTDMLALKFLLCSCSI